MKIRTDIMSTALLLCLWAVGAAAQEPSLITETEQLAAELNTLKNESVELYALYAEAVGDDRLALWARLDRRGDQIGDKLERLIENIGRLRDNGQSVDRPLAVAEEILDVAFDLIRTDLDSRREIVTELLRRRVELSPEEYLANEQEIARELLALDMLLSGYLKYCTLTQDLGVDAIEQLAFLDRLLLDDAASLAAHIKVAQDRTALVQEGMKSVEGNAAVQLRAEQRALEQRVQTASNSLTSKVAKMSLVTTSITTFDNQVLIVPNGKIWGSVIRNKSAEPTRRVDLVFRVGHSEDIARTELVLWEVVESDERVLKEPAPTIKVHELGEWSVDFIVRPWVQTEDYFAVYWDLTRAVKDRFDKEGIRLPVPQRDVHVHGEEKFKGAKPAASTHD